MMIALLFTIAKTWKQPKRPSTNEWIKKMCVYTHTHTQTNIMEYYSVVNKKDNVICSNMDSKRDYHTKWSLKEKDKYHIISLICGIRNMTQMNPSVKQKQNHRQKRLVIAMAERVGVSRCKFLYIEWINNRSYYIAQRTIFIILW